MTNTDEVDDSKFNASQKLKLQKCLRASLRNIYNQKIFLKLARESGYKAAEAFKSSDIDDKAVDGDMN